MQLRFTSPQVRSDFLAALKIEDPYLFGHIRPLYSQPTVAVVDDVENTARLRLKTLLAKAWSSRVRIYDDRQFQTFAG